MDKQRINVTMPKKMLEELDAIVKEMGMNRSGLINFVVKNYIDSQKIVETVGTKGNLEELANKIIAMSKEQ